MIRIINEFPYPELPPWAESWSVQFDPPGGDYESVPFFVARARGWAALAAKWLAEHPRCAVCRRVDGCVPHHVVPVHVDPALELEWDNLLTACERCHLVICHLYSWRSWNCDARADAARWREKIERRPHRVAEETGHDPA